MKMFKGQLFLFLMIYIRSLSCDLESIYNAGKEIWNLYSMMNNMTSTTSYIAFQQYKYQVDQIHKQLQEIENSMNSKIMSDSFKLEPYPLTLYKSLDTVEIFMQAIDQDYDNFRQKIHEMSYNGDDLRYFMRSAIPDIEEKIITIRRKVLESDELLKANLIFAITGHATVEQPHLCNSPRIISEVLFQWFKMIIIAEMKAHVMSATVSRYQYLSHHDSEWKDHLSRETLKTQIGLYVNLFTSNMLMTDIVYLRACEPYNNHWIRDQSFYELEGTFQAAIFRYNREKCNVNTCHDMWFKESRKCEAHYYDDRSGCSGNITQCTDLKAIQACVLKSGPHKFHHVNSTGHGLLGIPRKCPSSNSYVIEDGSGRNSSHGACACNCHENDNNEISLSMMESNVKSGMVITGLRFIRQNEILHIQPREGKLYADGRIRRYTERWIPIPKNISASEVHTINAENRVFFLDDLRLPSNFVLTGVKFERVQRSSVIGFAIKIFGVPFNFKTGELNSDPNFVVSSLASSKNLRTPLAFEAINSASKTLPLTVSLADQKYVSLEQSHIYDDFGQSTLPLFDAVPVIPKPQLPLGGIGIFHKGTDGYAGFISFRVYGIKYAHFFEDFLATCMKNDSVLFE